MHGRRRRSDRWRSPGFVAAMDRSGPWEPVPILVASAPPGGPADDAFFRRCIARIEDGLASTMPFDAVYITNHGAMTTTVDEDPGGELYAAVRAQIGPDVPPMRLIRIRAVFLSSPPASSYSSESQSLITISKPRASE